MALVKYLTESQIITPPLTSTTINDVLKLDNKELLLVSLLEKLCQTLDKDNQLFKTICQYLNRIGILEDHKLFSDNKKLIRRMYSDYMIKLIGKCNTTITNHNDDITSMITIDKLVINNSLYAMNFIELERIGNGGFGEVYKVYNRIDTHKYAIKIVPFNDVNDPNNFRAFNEVRCLSELSHQNIARYYTAWLELSDKSQLRHDESDELDEVNDDDDTSAGIYPVMYIQMELCLGNLREYLMQRNYSGLSSDMTTEKQMIYGIADGLRYIHDNDILHRDLNPNNIFLDANMTPKIGDFGMAIKLEKNDGKPLTMSADLGVCLYMPPEYEEQSIYTKKSDVYSAGIIFFEILNMFKTDMERYKVINEMKRQLYPDTFQLLHSNYHSIINKMIDHDPICRPDFIEIVHFINHQE
jgi:serine/threonine protein kinase